jgi:hypothetical protein
MFLHGDIWHLGNNMLILFCLGNALEHYVGKISYVVLYFCSGILAALGSVVYNMNHPVCVGASGAVFGITGAMAWLIIKNRGQSVIITKKKERLKKYDVAFYIRDNGAYVLHRVIEVTDSGYVTCGDAQFMREQVGEEQVFGVLAGFYVGKEYIEATNQKYLRKVKRWYRCKLWRKVLVKLHSLRSKRK